MIPAKHRRVTVAVKLHPDAVKRLKEIASHGNEGYLTHARGILEDNLLPANHPARRRKAG